MPLSHDDESNKAHDLNAKRVEASPLNRLRSLTLQKPIMAEAASLMTKDRRWNIPMAG